MATLSDFLEWGRYWPAPIRENWGLFLETVEVSGGGGSFTAPYQWDAALDVTDPGSGYAKGNSATPSSISILSISATDRDSSSQSTLLSALKNQDRISLTSEVDSDNYVFEVNGDSVNHTTWFEIPVTLGGSSGGFSQDENITLNFAFLPIVDHGELEGLEDDDHLQYLLRGEWLQNGFVDADGEVSLSWDDVSRTLTIEPTGASFDFFWGGELSTRTGPDTETIEDTEGGWWFYYDSLTNLTSIHNPTNVQLENLIENECLVAYVYWDATNNNGKLADELHGSRMSPATHHYLHDIMKAQYYEGLELQDIDTDQSGDVDAHAQFGTSIGQIYDDDRKHNINAVASTVGEEIFYIGPGLTTRWTTNVGFSVLTAGTGRLAYNDTATGTLVEVTNNDFVLCHVFAMNVKSDAGADQGPISIVGQAEYTTISKARDGADSEIAGLLTGGLLANEFVPLYSIIFQTSNSYSNAVKGRTRTTSTGEDAIDWRITPLSGGSFSATSHGDLSGLLDDDHNQYLLASDATDRATFATDWTDLTDGGVTALHSHSGSGDPDAIHDNVDDEIVAIENKGIPLSEGDVIVIEDADDSFSKKSVTLSDLLDGTPLTIPSSGLVLPHTVDFADSFFTTGQEIPDTSFYIKDGFAPGVVQASGYSSAIEPDYPVTPAYTISKIYDTNTTGGTAGFWIDLGSYAVEPLLQTAIIRMEIHVSGPTNGTTNRLMCELATHPVIPSTGPTFGRVRNSYRASDNIYRTYEFGSQLAANIWGSTTWSYSPGPTGAVCVFQVEFDFSVPQIRSRLFGTYDTNIGRQDGGWKTESVPTLDDIDKRLRYARFSFYAGTGTARYIFHQAWIGTGSDAWPNGRVDS